MAVPHDPGPHWGEVGIHGLHRQREWDAIATVALPVGCGDEAWVVALTDGRAWCEEGVLDAAALVEALDFEPPYRAHAVRRTGDVWAVAATRIETSQLPAELLGDHVELTWDGSQRSTRIDGMPAFRGVPALERLADARYTTYAATATRLDGTTWEVSILPL